MIVVGPFELIHAMLYKVLQSTPQERLWSTRGKRAFGTFYSFPDLKPISVSCITVGTQHETKKKTLEGIPEQQ